MILPTKHIPLGQSLLGLGPQLLTYLERPRTITALWKKARQLPEIGTFERFLLALSFLFAVGAVELQDDLLRRTQH